MSTAGLPIVLVHGAWMGAAVWERVATALRTRGFSVTAVELPGHGADPAPPDALTLTGYTQAVLGALPADGPVVLVGHSLGGIVVSAVAEEAPSKVARLVYVSAYLPRAGESLYQLAQTDGDSLVPKYWSQENPQAYSPASVRADGIAEVFAADATADDQAWLARTHRPEALGPMGTPVHLTPERFGRVPRVYVHTAQDRAVSYALQQRMLAAAGGAERVVTLDTSHVPMLTQPSALAEVIAEAARPARSAAS